MRYQSETPVIEAVQYICPRYNTTTDTIQDCFNEFPDWLRDAFSLGIVIDCGPNLKIKRANYCSLRVYEGNWIICSVPTKQSEFYPKLYPCDEETFFQIYEEVENAE